MTVTNKRNGVVSKWQAFLAAYRVTASITRAAGICGISRELHYKWLKELDGYPELFKSAQEEVAQALEDEAIRRAVDGTEEPLTYQGAFTYPPSEWTKNHTGTPVLKPNAKPLTVRKYSDGLLQFLLKGFRPDKYRERAAVELTGKDGAPIAIDPGMAALSDEQLSQLDSIAQILATAGNDRGRNPPSQTE